MLRSGLYWSLPRDRIKAAIREAREAGIIGPRKCAAGPGDMRLGSAGPVAEANGKAGADRGPSHFPSVLYVTTFSPGASLLSNPHAGSAWMAAGTNRAGETVPPGPHMM